ncbi:thioredoxin domain-containing protein 17-like isoform X2 [Biomphalaria glabrata]|uniref:Thioredoxin domain-containing protein 17 n=1 Tax=Biomphalaria glabrata TaxID=6526 RepID=A0A9W2YEF7_BIOGL|nr:thioredoxin domain-containing protein 17-like isoform X2 [Biomphalaria glabrata]
MEPTRHLDVVTVRGYSEIKSALRKADKGQYDSIYVFFTGDKDQNGVSWCPDCVRAEPFIHGSLDKTKGRSIFFWCYVGERDKWKNPKNQFRVDPVFQLKCIPTLIKIGTKRLTEAQCCRDDLLDLIFDDDSDECRASARTNVSSSASKQCCMCILF